MNDYFKVIKWNYSIVALTSPSKYMKIVIDLLDLVTKECII